MKTFASFHPATLNSPAALLGRADDVRVRLGENNIRHWRCSRNNRGDEDAHTVDRKAPDIPGTGRDLFVNDDESTTRQVNRLINTRYRDLDTVDAEDGYHDTSLATMKTPSCTRALGSVSNKDTGNSVATHIQNKIFDSGLRPSLIPKTLSHGGEQPGCERATQYTS